MKEMTPFQIGKLLEVAGAALRKYRSNFRAADIQAVLGSPEIIKQLVSGFIARLEQLVQTIAGVFRIPVNYGEPGAIAKAIAEAKFDRKYVGLAPAEIPLIGTGQVAREVHEVHFGCMMYNRDLPDALIKKGQELGYKNGFKFADPLTALRLACVQPDEQRKYPLAILFIDGNGQLWYLYLIEDDGERRLRVDRDNPDDDWYGHVRFLAVSEQPLVS